MAPKPDIVYSRGRSKYVDPSQRLIGMSDDEQDLEYVPPGTQTPTPAARATRDTPKKVESSVVTASQYDEEHALTGTSSRSVSGSEVASGSEEAFGSESAHSTRSNEATTSDSGS